MQSLLRRRSSKRRETTETRPTPCDLAQDKSSQELEIAALIERTQALAASSGLPAVGSRMTNPYGIEWRVEGHYFAPSIATLGRIDGEENSQSLYPISVPLNLSEKLQRLLGMLGLCTTKDFVPLDTVPELRPGLAAPGSHWVDSMSDPTRIYLFLDAARLPESVLAHELGHLWIELVEGLEDYRVLEDLSDSVRYSQVQMLQSFVLDRLVNRFLFDQGFDLKEIEGDRSISISELAFTASRGYCPKNLWERVTMATLLAEEDLDRRQVESHFPVRDSLTAIKDAMPDVWALSRDLMGAVEAEPLTSPDAVKRCVDRVLTLCFTFAEEHFNIEDELIERCPVVESFDETPSWLPGFSPEQKCEVGKVMARLGLDPGTGVRVFPSESGQAYAAFEGGPQSVSLPFFLRLAMHTQQRPVRPTPMNKPNPIAPPIVATGPQVPTFPTTPKPSVPISGRRSYSTGLARFISEVRLQEMLGGEHPYGYAFSNPTTYIDPSGLDPCPPAVEKARQDLSVQLMLMSWDKRNAKLVNSCIQDSAAAGMIGCGTFNQRHALCLRDNFPLVSCNYDGTGPCAGNPYAYSPDMPMSLSGTGRGIVHHLVLCLGSSDGSKPLICDRSGTNYLPQLQRNQQQVFWESMLHEGLHNCAFHHGEDLRARGQQPTADRTCNEIAACCINRVMSGASTKPCKTSLPGWSGPSGTRGLIGGLG